ncbi:hypothetical protein BUALT_Bualt13G0065500 [Buddleja alternifolia]|uniref:Protein FAR1-RELATED SEQUENCE n=1 Tax=Buddleja alternifolia TaxID=168488 RepID=A0AAV6WTS2_9LAMI|nr:hypothetical protein BUALT_Bualt13G0065500 [Buddleja alternifolia]
MSVICCVHQGYKEGNKVKNSRLGKEIGCQAIMRIKVNKLRKWMITKVILDHNHNTTPSNVFPRARHRLCLWHITQKVPQQLNGHNEYKSIKRAVEATVYDSSRVSELEQAWKEMIDDHGFGDNKWVQSLYCDKEKWIPIFLKDTFFAGMSATQRREIINAFFDGITKMSWRGKKSQFKSLEST